MFPVTLQGVLWLSPFSKRRSAEFLPQLLAEKQLKQDSNPLCSHQLPHGSLPSFTFTVPQKWGVYVYLFGD